MFYLIGGPPKCGKTTLAKRLARKKRIPWISSDALQVVSREYLGNYVSNKQMRELYPSSRSASTTNDERFSVYTPREVARQYMKQAKSTYLAIDMFIASELADGNDYIIEGYHVTPELVSRLQKKYGRKQVKAVFLGRQDAEQMVKDFHKSTTPNDWVLAKTHNESTYEKIAEMIAFYSEQVQKQSKKHGYRFVWMDKDFNARLRSLVGKF